MLFYLGSYLQSFFGPARLLQYFTVLIALALYSGFVATYFLLPKFYDFLPHDRGREFTLTAEAAKGKPTGAGSVFITIFALLALLIIPMGPGQAGILLLTWLTMLTGFLDDKSVSSWGEYLKAFLDLLLSIAIRLSVHSATKVSPTATNSLTYRRKSKIYSGVDTLVLNKGGCFN